VAFVEVAGKLCVATEPNHSVSRPQASLSRRYNFLTSLLLESPSLVHSMAGLVTTVVNVYTARGGFWSVTAIVTAAVAGSCTTFMLAFFLFFDLWLLRKVKRAHMLAIEAERGRMSATTHVRV